MTLSHCQLQATKIEEMRVRATVADIAATDMRARCDNLQALAARAAALESRPVVCYNVNLYISLANLLLLSFGCFSPDHHSLSSLPDSARRGMVPRACRPAARGCAREPDWRPVRHACPRPYPCEAGTQHLCRPHVHLSRRAHYWLGLCFGRDCRQCHSQ